MLETPGISEYRCLEVQLPNMVKISDRSGQSAGKTWENSQESSETIRRTPSE